MTIDLSSDTATRPTPAMRQAMAAADVGDEQKQEDPTTNTLQERAATLLGKPAALFVASATMANLCALLVHTKPGDEVLGAARSHVSVYEGGGYAAVAGSIWNPLPTENGVFTGQQITAAVAPDDPHFPPTRLLWLENTHNDSGGTAWTLAQLEDAGTAARRAGLAVHMDGARLLNACAAQGYRAADGAGVAHSVTLCLSKGLGCPAGAILAGTPEFIAGARRAKQRLGGMMRQSGVLAAAGLYALDNNIPQLATDNNNAQAFARGLAHIPRVQCDPSAVATNLVYFTVDGMTAADARARLSARGVLVSGNAARLRAVTHLDISAPQIEQALDIVRQAFA